MIINWDCSRKPLSIQLLNIQVSDPGWCHWELRPRRISTSVRLERGHFEPTGKGFVYREQRQQEWWEAVESQEKAERKKNNGRRALVWNLCQLFTNSAAKDITEVAWETTTGWEHPWDTSSLAKLKVLEKILGDRKSNHVLPILGGNKRKSSGYCSLHFRYSIYCKLFGWERQNEHIINATEQNKNGKDSPKKSNFRLDIETLEKWKKFHIFINHQNVDIKQLWNCWFTANLERQRVWRAIWLADRKFHQGHLKQKYILLPNLKYKCRNNEQKVFGSYLNITKQ